MKKTELYAVKLWRILGRCEFDKLVSIVSREKYERIIRNKDTFEARRILLGELLVRWVLHTRMGIQNRKIEFCINEFGKPFIKDINNINFNLSHSQEWVVCGFSSFPIGIDIEKISPIDFNG